MPKYRRTSVIDGRRETVFEWHRRPGAFERLAPPWTRTRILGTTGAPPEPGAEVRLAVRLGPFWRPWTARHEEWEPGHYFTDRQLQGPFGAWHHLHRFNATGDDKTRLEDVVTYALPFGPLGRLGERVAEHEVDRMFAYRHRVTMGDIATHTQHDLARQRVAMTGSSGLVGTALAAFLRGGGHTVTRLVRQPTAAEDCVARTATGWPNQSLESVDTVVHLAGENLANGRWSPSRKARIRGSRVDGTRRLAEQLAHLEHPPRTLLCASAIGIYGDRGTTSVDETASPGHDFLAGVCEGWEQATRPAADAGIRVVHLRFGIVLTPGGGALGRMLPPFLVGAGGRLGSGRQMMSWIALDDVLGAVLHTMATPTLDGPVNVVAPEAVDNRTFTRTLGTVLRRPTMFPVPAGAMRLLFGEMADALLLSGAHVRPAALLRSGFRFQYPTLESGLRHLLGRDAQ